MPTTKIPGKLPAAMELEARLTNALDKMPAGPAMARPNAAQPLGVPPERTAQIAAETAGEQQALRAAAQASFDANRSSMGFGKPPLPGGSPPATSNTSSNPMLRPPSSNVTNPMLLNAGQALLQPPETFRQFAGMSFNDPTQLGDRMQRLTAIENQRQARAATADPETVAKVNALAGRLAPHVNNGVLPYGPYAPGNATAGSLVAQPWARDLAEAHRLNSTLPAEHQVPLPGVQFFADKLGSGNAAAARKAIWQGTRDRQAAIEAQRAADPIFQKVVANAQGQRARDQMVAQTENPLLGAFSQMSAGHGNNGMPSMLDWAANPDGAKLQAEGVTAQNLQRGQQSHELTKLDALHRQELDRVQAQGANARDLADLQHRQSLERARVDAELGGPERDAKIARDQAEARFNDAQGKALLAAADQKVNQRSVDPYGDVEDPARRAELTAMEESKGGNLTQAVENRLNDLYGSSNLVPWVPDKVLPNYGKYLRSFQDIAHGAGLHPKSVERWWEKTYGLPNDYTRLPDERQSRDLLTSNTSTINARGR